MTRFLVLIAGSALACALVTGWAIAGRSGESWVRFAHVDERLTDLERRQAAYPVRLELPVARAAALSTSAPGLAPAERSTAELTASPGLAEAPAAASPPAQTPGQGNRNGLLAFDFDIATYGRVAAGGTGGVRARKPLVVDGQRLGEIDLAVGEGTIISVDRRALASLIDEREPRLSAALERLQGDRVTLDSLRTRDVRVRYDPITDALVIETTS